MKKDIWIGVDIGSISLKIAALIPTDLISEISAEDLKRKRFFLPNDPSCQKNNKRILLSDYRRHFGQPISSLSEMIKALYTVVSKERVACIHLTGSGGKRCQEKLGYEYLNEYRAVAKGISTFYPDVKTIFEMGGESAKYIRIDGSGHDDLQILDYETNGECAAGTGSFFDQQVERLKIKIEDVGSLVQDVKRTACIAGRCSVFAKSDMIHAQQRGYSPSEILKGLCEAVVRNFKGTITKGKQIEPVVALVGGVAANQGVVNAFKQVFHFDDHQFIVPVWNAWMGAIGAVLTGFDHGLSMNDSIPARALKTSAHYPTVQPLSMKKVTLLRDRVKSHQLCHTDVIPAYLGLDIGSVSTNLALITDEGELIHGIYRMTEGRPVAVVDSALKEMADVVGKHVRIMGVGTTGSGRELIGALVGADVIKDEITAHKTGAVHVSQKYLNKNVDTIFEVGGQDSKFISIRDGVVVDFALNEACAAGTGSFLEEQAGQLGIAIRDEFAEIALRSEHPLKLGERCTVFIEKELIPYLQQGIEKEDIVAGLAYSVVQNYINRVVKKRPIGDVIFFQGGTAYNDSVAAAFATLLDKEIVVPPHNGIMGAIGAALLAHRSALLAHRRMKNKEKSGFRGWDLDKVSWHIRDLSCTACSNRCMVQEFTVEGEKHYWGDKCSDRFRQRTKSDHKVDIPDLTTYRDTVLFPGMDEDGESPVPKKGVIGIPRILTFYDRFPFWKVYLEYLGFSIRLSDPSRKDIIDLGVELTVAEPCFPIQVAHGHIMTLIKQEVDYIFLPHILNEEDPLNSVASFVCPWGQTIPLVSMGNPGMKRFKDRFLLPTVPFREGRILVEQHLFKEMKTLQIGAGENHEAVQMAYEAQSAFKKKIREKGKAVWSHVEERKLPCVVLVGRPYNLYDSGLNLNIPAKLQSLYGINVLPMDFLPFETLEIHDIHDHMFWNYGRRILQVSRFIGQYPNLHFIYISNFKCGPDSYIRHYVKDAAGEPFLFLQLDGHANDAGVMTRIEAFLESKGMI